MMTIVSAVILGVGVLLAGSVPWAGIPGAPGLAGLNLRLWPAVPWAMVPMALYLRIYWQFIGGAIGPRGSAEWRRLNLRAHSVSGDRWGLSVLAGLLGFGALIALLAVMQRLVDLPPSPSAPTPTGMPFITLFLLLVMASIVAGVTEEAAFRGYMQTPIERRYGVIVAILVNGTMFGLLHFPSHPTAVLTMLPYYIGVAAVYSGLTWATDSILPALVLHAGGDVFSLTRLWTTGRAEWQLTAERAPLVWERGFDAAFAGAMVALVLLAGATAWAYLKLRARTVTTSPSGSFT
jgi:membrane protease YdiL (CAAX protease family)